MFIATSPGSIGNIGPGLDVLGCALVGLRDEVIAQWSEQEGITLLDAGHADLPSSPLRHTSGIAAAAVMKEAERRGVTRVAAGVALRVRKKLPLSGGQGGSAASAVAGAVATNALFGDVLEPQALLQCCLEAEATVAGRHLDNIAPSLMGGIVLVRAVDPIDVIALPASEWEVFGRMSGAELAGHLRDWAGKINLERVKKAPPRKLTTTTTRRFKDTSPHVSTARLLNEAKKVRQAKANAIQ